MEASEEHYESFCKLVDNLVDSGEDLNINLTIKFRGVSVDLSLNESLIVINSLAVRRAALRGGLWSTAGKQVEKPLIKTLCMIFEVPKNHYVVEEEPISIREVDNYLIGRTSDKLYRCEVKLMGKGNPESADSVFSRESNVFIADKLGPTSKNQLDDWGIEWIEMRQKDGYKKFYDVLKKFNIPCKDFFGDIDNRLNEILSKLFER